MNGKHMLSIKENTFSLTKCKQKYLLKRGSTTSIAYIFGSLILHNVYNINFCHSHLVDTSCLTENESEGENGQEP